MNPDDFKVTENFASYVSKPEITDLGPTFLVKGSKNVIIDYAQRVRSRLGYILFGAVSNGGSGIKSSYDWNSSNGWQFPLRAFDDKLQFYWNSAWQTLKSGFATPYMSFCKVWDNTEKIDVLIMVLGDTNSYKWSGGVQKVRSSTGTTLTKQGVLTAVNTIAFVAGTPGSVAPIITDSANNFLNAGFTAGDTLYVTGSAANSRNFLIASVTAGIITLAMSNVLVSEAAGPAITLHNGSPTWATSRFLTTGTRKITYLGIEYVYTGGESTDTLTGLTAFPAVTLGDTVFQTMITLANPGAIPASFRADLCAVQTNQLILASTKSQDVYGSSTLDYTNFTLTSPRVPGDPWHVTMDAPCTVIAPIDNLAQTTSSIMFGGGPDEFFQLSFQLSQDNLNEIVRMIKLKTATSSGIISRGAYTPIKNATAYIAREPSLDTLENVEAADSKNIPISDPIKDDFDSYDFTDAHMKYWKRSIIVALPAEGVVLIYDLMRKLWQPPQFMPIGRLSIYNDALLGHSSVVNESYQLFTGTNDNGNYIPQKARFAYNNGGRRDRLKNMNEYWADGYITSNGLLNMHMNLGFAGSIAKKMMSILGNDTSVVISGQASPLGSEPFGSIPLGGAPIDEASGLSNGTGPLLNRFWQVDTMDQSDYTEFFVEYEMDTFDGQFAIVAHGCNQWDAGTSPNSHKK